MNLDLTSKENFVNYRRPHNLVSCIPFYLTDNSGEIYHILLFCKGNQESTDFSATAKALSFSDNSMDCLAAIMTTGLNDLKSLSLER